MQVSMERFVDDRQVGTVVSRTFVGTMTDEIAIKRASNLVSEVSLYGVALGLVFFEFQVSNADKEAKDAKAADERRSMEHRLRRVEAEISSMRNLLEASPPEHHQGWNNQRYVGWSWFRFFGFGGGGGAPGEHRPAQAHARNHLRALATIAPATTS